MKKLLIITIIIVFSALTACGKTPETTPSPEPGLTEPEARQTPPPMTADPQGATDAAAVDSEIYEWLKNRCQSPVTPQGYSISGDEALKRISVYMGSYWEYFSDLDFPGDYYDALLYADKYEFAGWDESWMLILHAADADGYEWSDSLVLNARDGQIMFGPSGARNPGYDSDPEGLMAMRERYYDYFEKNNRIINPFFTYASVNDISDDSLIMFAILNLDYDHDRGLKTSEIDAVLLKHFGRTVKSYQTGMSEYDGAAGIVRASGWDAHGAYRLMLMKLTENSDGTLTGVFNVYLFEEMSLFDHPGALEAARDSIIYGDTTRLELFARARITFEEIAEPGGFYLKFRSIEAAMSDRTYDVPPAPGFDYEERQFDANSRFSSEEAVFNGITVGMPVSEMRGKLGNPFEVIDVEDRPDEKIYLYRGVEVYAGDYINVISIVGFNWKYGPRNIRVGDTFEDVLSKFPSEKDWRTDPYGCFYGDDTMSGDAGAAYDTGAEGSGSRLIIVTPPDIVPFIRIHFEYGKVTTINICSLS